MKLINLFIDESGSANPKQQRSECYILCGCVVNDRSRELLKIRADQVKFKYWGKTSVVFHSREIGRKLGDFKILRDKKINEEFQKDLFNFLSSGNYRLFIVVVDNRQAAKKNWNERKVYKETAEIMIGSYILALVAGQNQRGRLVVESATSEKDFIFHKTASYFLSNGISRPKIPFQVVQNALTEISFVSKKNFDIEEQIADLLAYGAKLKFLEKKNSGMSDYQRGIKKIMESKLFKMHPNTGRKKRKFYSKIESFKILP